MFQKSRLESTNKESGGGEEVNSMVLLRIELGCGALVTETPHNGLQKTIHSIHASSKDHLRQYSRDQSSNGLPIEHVCCGKIGEKQ